MQTATHQYRIGSTIVAMTSRNATAWNRGELDSESLDGATVAAIVDIPEARIERDRAYPLSEWIGGEGEWTDHARDMEGVEAVRIDAVADADAIADAITRSRQCDEIVAVTVIDLAAAIREAERIGAAAEERTDWAEDVARESGAAVVSMWGWDDRTADQDHSAWRIEIVERVNRGDA